MFPREANIDASHLLVLSRVSSEEFPGFWSTFSPNNLPLTVFHKTARTRTVMFIVPYECKKQKKAATVCCLLAHNTASTRGFYMRELLKAIALSVSCLCRFASPLSVPPKSLFFSFISLLPLWRSQQPPRAQKAGLPVSHRTSEWELEKVEQGPIRSDRIDQQKQNPRKRGRDQMNQRLWSGTLPGPSHRRKRRTSALREWFINYV